MKEAAQHSQAYTYCAYCPKGCRYSCPVSDATQNEALSAWGKMTAVHLAQRTGKPLDAGAARAAHACTGCMRCTQVCKHDNEVGPALFAARAQTIGAGTQPQGAASTLASFTQSQNPFGVELAGLVHNWRPKAPVRYALFPGCSTLVKRPALVDDVVAVSSRLGAPMGVAPIAARCCGYPLYAAGAHEAFAAHARSMAEALDAVPSSSCLTPAAPSRSCGCIATSA
jgi:Fe-S oxidoreductase